MLVRLLAALLCAGIAPPAFAVDFDEELVVNGDAETGDTFGWNPATASVLDSTSPVFDASPPPPEPLDSFVFEGGQGPLLSTLAQTIDIGDVAATIDAGDVDAVFHALLQSRAVAGASDTVTASLFFKDGVGTDLTAFSFPDPSASLDQFDWDAVDATISVPPGTRSIEIVMDFSRTVGGSTDAYADNISLMLQDLPEPAVSLGLLAGAGLLSLLRRRSLRTGRARSLQTGEEARSVEPLPG